MPDVHVGRLQSADLHSLLRLYALLHPDDPPVAREKLEQTWRAIVHSHHLPYVGAWADGVLVSTCHAVIVPNLTRGARPYAVIENVATDASYRRQGYGRLAMQALIALCWAADCYKIQLASGNQRGPAHAFYRALGFDGEAKRAFLLKAPTRA